MEPGQAAHFGTRRVPALLLRLSGPAVRPYAPSFDCSEPAFAVTTEMVAGFAR